MLSAQGPAGAMREVSGTVSDPHHEPVRGAVVELKNPADGRVVSYLTDERGHYDFKRLDSSTDFVVGASFRGHHSRWRPISKFDSHLAKTINFTVHTY